MRNEALTARFEAAKSEMKAHWSSSIEAGLEGFTPAGTKQIDAAIESFFANLKALPEPATDTDLLMPMKRVFERLDELNEAADGGLLETDERELLVPIIIDASVISGLDITKFSDGDPTAGFRKF